MKKLIISLILVTLLVPVFAEKKVSGVVIEEQVNYRGSSYNLSGAGLRNKFIIGLYVGSLYTDRSVSDENSVLRGPAVSVIRLDIISDIITSELMQKTIEEGFDKAMDGDTSYLRNQIDNFIGIFNEEINKGDQFNFLSIPGTGVYAYKGDRELAVINDERFREVLLSIWLGDNPAQKSLKKAMLGN